MRVVLRSGSLQQLTGALELVSRDVALTYHVLVSIAACRVRIRADIDLNAVNYHLLCDVGLHQAGVEALFL